MADMNLAQVQQGELREWINGWLIDHVGISATDIDEDKPLDELGLSSRDAVLLAGDIERHTGVHVEPTVVYEHNTITALAHYVASGGSASAHSSSTNSVDFLTGTSFSSPADRDIAIVGMAARYPGADSVDELWTMLLMEEDHITEPPEGRWREYDQDSAMQKRLEKAALSGGYITDIAGFDAEFFGLSPLEAESMDPQQRILLQLTWEALEDAGLPANQLKGTPVGVFMGSTNNDYALTVSSDSSTANPYALTGNSTSLIANRLSYFFDFRGPSVAMDTACSSSLVAIHQAVRSLREGDSTVAIAGGVNLLANPFGTVAFSELGVLSPTGKIHAFSDDADGIVRSDGAGVLILKRLSDARAHGDEILGVIKGSAVNSDGRSNGITAPNPDAQIDCLAAAYRDARIDPTVVDYVEAHGTGTILGDPIEARALGEVLGRRRANTNPLLLGSIKTNIGHTEAAAGVAGVIKVIRSMQNGCLPASLNYTAPNRYIDFDSAHIEVVDGIREWPEYSGAPLAGISGFGFGGTNAHVVIAAPDSPLIAPVSGSSASLEKVALRSAEVHAPALIPVSGYSPSRRQDAAENLKEYLDKEPTPESDGKPWDEERIHSLSYSLGKRNHGRARGLVIAHSKEEAVSGLEKLIEQKKNPAVYSADSPQKEGSIWVYSGFGSQHIAMGKELFASSPFAQKRITEMDEILIYETGWSLVEQLEQEEPEWDTEKAQVGITLMQILYTDILLSLGLSPTGVIGQSQGEIAAAYAAGGLSWQDAVRMSAHRSRLMGEGERHAMGTSAEGAMAVVDMGVEELQEFISVHPEFAGVEPAVYAAPSMTTVGGSRPVVVSLVEFLEKEERFARLLPVRAAGHTSALDPILGELAAELSTITPLPLRVPLYSTVNRGEVYPAGAVVHTPDYFVACTRESVWFVDATRAALNAGMETFVEIAPHSVALMAITNTAAAEGKTDISLLSVAHRKQGAWESLAHSLAVLYVQGADLDFGVWSGSTTKIDIPGVRWKNQIYWTQARSQSAGRAGWIDLPGGDRAYKHEAALYTDASQLVMALDAEAVKERMVAAEYDSWPQSGELTTILSRSITGQSYKIYAQGAQKLIAEVFVLKNMSSMGLDIAGVQSSTETQLDSILTESHAEEILPSSPGEKIREIISESMGYAAEDLPMELPLTDLGLDSLMGMRIKNRVEHEFSLDDIPVQTLRDASLADVITLVEQRLDQKKAPAEVETADAVMQDTNSTPQESSPTTQTGVGVAPRDASERLVFATWMSITGQSIPGVTSELPSITETEAERIAQRLSDRSGGTIEVAAIQSASTLEVVATLVREFLETEVEGNIRILRERPQGSVRPAVFLFHPAGGSSAVYQPLMRLLPDDLPVYGVERREGKLEERAAEYLQEIVDYAQGYPLILGGWSFGGVLAYEVAHQLSTKHPEVQIQRIELLDTVQPAEPAPDTKEELHKRWDRYAAFAKKTYGLEVPIPHELLEEHGEEAMLALLANVLDTTDPSSHGLSAGVLEHQRASFVDNRILEQLDLSVWSHLDIPTTLYKAERMHDGAVELEPAYAVIAEDGGWGTIITDLEIVHLHGDHLAVVDEPEINTVAVHMVRHLSEDA